MTGLNISTDFPSTIFRIRTDGTGYQILHTFSDTNEGLGPSGSLILGPLFGATTLYGMMAFGGSSNAGTIFRIDSDGSHFEVLYAFLGLSNDGVRPWASVISDGSGYFYGTTTSVGTPPTEAPSSGSDRMAPASSSCTTSWAALDGASPRASLVLDRAGNLYGTTPEGGPSNGGGTVFKMRTDGTGFQLLHTFLGSDSDGLHPLAALILDGTGNLYGTTSGGGPSDLGTVFRMKIDGTNFQLLHTFSFDSTSDGGSNPTASLILDGSGNLYGTASYGGSGLNGTVFKLRTDGTGFQVLHSFTGLPGDGSGPWAPLTLDGSGNLYGTTTSGGASSLGGTVFKLKTDGTGFQLLHSFVGDESEGGSPEAPVILDGFGNLYGTAYYGGPSEAGDVFTMRTDGTAYRILHMFGSEAGDGRNPFASLFMDGSGRLIGTTTLGGSADFGTVFALLVGQHSSGRHARAVRPVRKR